ncbi:MAG TPA: sigma-54 dependent transcriptional regulator [Steroidobacteraceae bacterium]|nr:sigma-54 dependent transcriptional regulator [Steroidobacteraceae bacterium]
MRRSARFVERGIELAPAHHKRTIFFTSKCMIEEVADVSLKTDVSATMRAEQDMTAFAPVSLRLVELARRVALSDCTVLIAGESGVGKEVLAHYIHSCSSRAVGPFVAVNCAAIPENMLEAILFGYERGAFTGAQTAHAGKFEQAQGGTLLLDEVSEMPLALQAKLLRVLQEREVERLGARGAVALNVRVLATTNRQLRSEVAAGHFREDLYYRLNVFPLTVAPLRERREDILPIAMRLLSSRCAPGARIPALSADAAHMLLTYVWPGNVRELDNVMQRALILCTGAVIESEHIRFESEESMSQESGAVVREGALADSVQQAERDAILEALRVGNGSRRVAAEKLGISPRTLRYKLARLRESGVSVPAA